MSIEPYHPRHLDTIVDLSLRAWAPVFDSIQQAMDPGVYGGFYPDHWSVSQRQAIVDVCASDDSTVWVAIESDAVVGFAAVNLHADDRMGEIHMIAVDPDHQDRGIGSALTEFAMDWMRCAGMTIAMVETGNDAGHAPARYTYEKAGFRQWPVARYFKKL